MYNIELITQKIKESIGYFAEPDIVLDPLKVKVVTSVSKAVNKRHPLSKLRIVDKIRPREQPISDYLSELRDRAVHDVLMRVYTTKKLSETTKGVLAQVSALYKMSDVNGIATQSVKDFIGYRLAPVGSDYLTITINKIGIALLSAQEINLYVYHSSDLSTPFKTLPLVVTNSGRPTWIDLPKEDHLMLDFFDLTLDRGGYYYIGIKTEELDPGNMVMSRDYDWSKPICGSCHMWDKAYYDSWSKYSRYSPIVGDLTGTELSEVETVNKVTHGLNFSYSVTCDITQFVIDNMEIVEEAIILQHICIILEEIINSTEVNRIAGVTKTDAELALYGEFSVNGRERIREGFETFRDNQLNAFSADISKLCNVCLPANRPKKLLKWRG